MPQSCHNIYTSQVKTPLNSIKKEFQSSIQSCLAGSPYMSALTKFVNIANTVRPPSLMVIFLLRRQQCQRQQYTPSVANVFYSFSFSSNVPLILLIAFPTWSQSKRVIENRKRVIENRNFANSCSTYGNYLVSFYPRSDLIVSFYLWNAYALVFRLTSPFNPDWIQIQIQNLSVLKIRSL